MGSLAKVLEDTLQRPVEISQPHSAHQPSNGQSIEGLFYSIRPMADQTHTGADQPTVENSSVDFRPTTSIGSPPRVWGEGGSKFNRSEVVKIRPNVPFCQWVEY